MISGIFYSPATLKAQSYFTSAGARLGNDLGITLQQRIVRPITIEGILSSNRYRWSCSFLLENHHRIIGKRLNFYTGIGYHFGDESGYGKYQGITPVLGLELTFARLTFSYDYKPQINLSGGSGFVFHSSAVSVRYVFIKQPKQKPFKKLWKNLFGK